MSLEKLVKRKKDIEKQLKAIDDEIEAFKDGFEYKIVIGIYRVRHNYIFNNLFSYKKKYNQYHHNDNGVIIMAESNNPRVQHLNIYED